MVNKISTSFVENEGEAIAINCRRWMEMKETDVGVVHSLVALIRDSLWRWSNLLLYYGGEESGEHGVK